MPVSPTPELQPLVNAAKRHRGEIAEVILRHLPRLAMALARQHALRTRDIARAEVDHRPPLERAVARAGRQVAKPLAAICLSRRQTLRAVRSLRSVQDALA